MVRMGDSFFIKSAIPTSHADWAGETPQKISESASSVSLYCDFNRKNFCATVVGTVTEI